MHAVFAHKKLKHVCCSVLERLILLSAEKRKVWDHQQSNRLCCLLFTNGSKEAIAMMYFTAQMCYVLYVSNCCYATEQNIWGVCLGL
jgi:hypothetical protein